MFNKWKTTFAVFLFKMSHNSKANVSLGSRQTAFPLSNLVTSLWWKKGKFLRSCLLTLIPLSNMKITTPPSSLEEMLSRVPLPTTSCPVYSQPVSPASHGGRARSRETASQQPIWWDPWPAYTLQRACSVTLEFVNETEVLRRNSALNHFPSSVLAEF